MLKQVITQNSWLILLPAIILCFGTMLLIIVRLLVDNKLKVKFFQLAIIFLLGVAVVAFFLLPNKDVVLHSGMYLSDQFSRPFQLLILIAGILIMLLHFGQNKVNEQMVEYQKVKLIFFLLAVFASIIMISSLNFFVFIFAVEIYGLATYVLIALDSNTHVDEIYISLNRYIITSMSATALLFFGYSYVYGLTGEVNILKNAEQIILFKNTSLHTLVSIAWAGMNLSVVIKLLIAPFFFLQSRYFKKYELEVTSLFIVISPLLVVNILLRWHSLFSTTRNVLAVPNGAKWVGVSVILIILAVVMFFYGIKMLLQTNKLFAFLLAIMFTYTGFSLVLIYYLNAKLILPTLWSNSLGYILSILGIFILSQVIVIEKEILTLKQFVNAVRNRCHLLILYIILLLSLMGLPGNFNMFKRLLQKNILFSFSNFIIFLLSLILILSFGKLSFRSFGKREEHTLDKVSLDKFSLVVLFVCGLGVIITPWASHIFRFFNF